ncbi:MAG: CHASE domain-containing protein, partial [Vicinamibacteria bacterium]
PEANRLSMLAGGLCALMGALVLAGWHTSNVTLIQVMPSWVPMQYNTALSFLLCGLGLLLAGLSQAKVPAACGVFAAMMGLLTLIEYAAGVNLGIDQLFMKSAIMVKTSHPGRMAPNTALSFLLGGTALLTLGWPGLRERPLIRQILGLVILSIGAGGVSGYLSGIDSPFSWGRYTRMAFLTSSGFIAFGAGVSLLRVRESLKQKLVVSPRFAVAVGVVVLAVTVALGAAMVRRDTAYARERLEGNAELVRDGLSSLIHHRARALVQMAERWTVRGGTPKLEWETDAKHILADKPGYHAVGWVDSSFHYRWVVERDGNPGPVGEEPLLNKAARAAMKAARSSEIVIAQRQTLLIEGGRGFAIYVPTFSAGRFDGLLVGAFDYEELFDSTLKEIGATDYGVEVYDGEKEVYR